MSTSVNLVRFYGNHARLVLPLTHPDTGAPFDPADSVLVFAVKLHPAQPDVLAKLRKLSTDGGFTRLGVGSLAVDLAPADWANLRAGVAYYVDVLAQHIVTGLLYTVFTGRLTPAAVLSQTGPLTIIPPVSPAITDENAQPVTDEVGAAVTS